MHNNFLFSVILSIDTISYFEESINSIINQTIGFKDNIQIIIIDSVGADDSKTVSEFYKNKYPRNVVTVDNNNQSSISVLKNKALELASGKYITFLNASDKWDIHAFKTIISTFKKFPEAKIASCKTKEYESTIGNHIFNNFKYKTTQLLNLDNFNTLNYWQEYIAGVVIDSKLIDDLKFPETMLFYGDTFFINILLCKSNHLLMIKNAEYIYREEYLNPTINENLKETLVKDKESLATLLFSKSKEFHGYIKPIFQSLVFNLFQQHFLQDRPKNSFNQQLKKIFFEKCKIIFQNIDDKVISRSKFFSLFSKAYALKLKHGNNFFKTIKWKKNVAFYNDVKLFSINKKNVALYSLKTRNNQLVIKGKTNLSMFDTPYTLFYMDNSKNKYQINLTRATEYDIKINNKLIIPIEYFTINLPLKENIKYTLYLEFENNHAYPIKPAWSIFSKFGNKFENLYHKTKEFIILNKNNSILIKKRTIKRLFYYEIKRIKEILLFKNTPLRIRLKAIFIRILYHLNSITKKEIWLISDKNNSAGDNGGNLFKYISQLKSSNIKPVFILNKNSSHYKEMKKYGKIVKPLSINYYIDFLRAKNLISAYAESKVYAPFFYNDTIFYKDLIDFNYIYLQHGVMQGQLLSYVEPEKNISLITVSTAMELNNLQNDIYKNNKQVIQLTGMARYDALGTTEIKRKIIFCPTWRNSLAGSLIGDGRTRMYLDNFSTSDYCKFYNALINNNRLLKAINEKNYEALFFIHPSFIAQADDFNGNETIIVSKDLANYEKELNEAALMITDYSGVSFDFAYQYKPIIYSQFDDLYAQEGAHSYKKTYYDYKTQSFGPITHTVDETVDAIINALNNDCKMEDLYKKRVDEFFTYHDKNNCQRIYDAIINLDTTKTN